MRLIKKLIEGQRLVETAAAGAVGAGAVATYAMPLFAKLTQRELPKKIRITKVKKEKKPKKGLGLQEAFDTIAEDLAQIPHDTFDTSEVISKLKSLENKETVNKHETQAFALEDDEGNMVKVRVRIEQASAFEAALNAFLSDQEVEDDKRGIPEIAEIIFKLKDRFDIIDIEWPEVQEDQEEAIDLAAAPGAEAPEGAEQLDLGAGAEEGAPEGLDLGAGETDETKSLLTQVIDMMKADAEARKAEAHARQAEAKAKEADLAKQQIYARVKQEEQILDMEADTKAKKEVEKEAKRLAQLARWKHEMEQDQGASFEETPEVGLDTLVKGREEEETLQRPPSIPTQRTTKRLGGRVAPTDVARFILSRVK